MDSLANRLGVSGTEFDSLVSNKTYNSQIQTNLANAEKDQALFQTGSDGTKAFGTPTIVANNKTINWQSDTNWLSELVSGVTPKS